jgi:flagellar hook-length control protein FliK
LRIFVLPSLSTHAITASNNTAKLPAKSNADNKPADSSPFGVMLAATEAQQAKPQAPKPVADEEHQASVKKSDAANKDAQAAPQTTSKDHPDNVAAKDTNKDAGKASDSKTADAKDHDAAGDKDNAAQTAQAQQTQVQQSQPPQVPQPAPQPDPAALAMAQAQAGLAGPGLPGTAAAVNDDGDDEPVGATGAAGTDNGKTASATPPAASGVPDIAGQVTADAADGIVPQNPANPAPNGGKNFASQLKAGADKSQIAGNQAASGNVTKLTAQNDNNAAQPQTPAPQADAQPQATAQTPPASPATNPAAIPALNFGTPVQTAGATGVSNTVQVSAHAADTASTVNTLAVSIAAKTQSGARQFDIRLDPPELGHVEVRLSIDASGKTEAHMTADHQDTLNLLQKDSSSLTQALRNAGLDVSSGGLNFSLRGQNSQGGDTGSDRGTSRNNLTASRAIGAAQGVTSSTSYSGGGFADGRLDIHV